jgi:hypothetical protein
MGLTSKSGIDISPYRYDRRYSNLDTAIQEGSG